MALLCGCLLLSGLPGCALLSGQATKPPLSESQKQLYRLAAWKLEGRIAAKMGQEGWNANLVWDHDGGQERLRIFGPFNQGTVSIIVQSDLVYVNEGNGVITQSRDPDAWLKNRLGFAVPLRSLRYWVLGLPAPDSEYKAELDVAGGLVGFEQGGWALAFERFDTVGDKVLPKKMTIRGSEVVLRLIADEWVFN